MKVSFITDPEQKESISLSVMHRLRFVVFPTGRHRSQGSNSPGLPFFAVFDRNKPVAFAAVKIHNPHTADIYCIGVLEEYQRQGLGHQLVQAILEWCVKENFVF